VKSDSIVKRNRPDPMMKTDRNLFIEGTRNVIRNPRARHVRKSMLINVLCDGKAKSDE